MLCFTWVVSSLLSCCYLSSRLLTLPRVYLLCLTWVVSFVVIYREEYLTKPYYKPRFSQWVASSKFVEFLNYFNCYNRGFCFELFFFIFFLQGIQPMGRTIFFNSRNSSFHFLLRISCIIKLGESALLSKLGQPFTQEKVLNAELTSVFTPALQKYASKNYFKIHASETRES